MSHSSRAMSALAAIAATIVLGACAPAPTGSPPDPGTSLPSVPTTGSWADQMVASANANRASASTGPLARCATLDRAAQLHSEDQAASSTMSHTGSDGSSMATRASRAGYTGWTALAENVAAGYGTVEAVMTGWMQSTGHRANLLNPTYTHIGVGSARSPGGTIYWTQVFGRSGSC